MKILKSKFRKKKTPKPLFKRKKPPGRWCEYYEGRIPFPIECQWNKEPPLCIDKPNCKHCKRGVEWKDWKMGKWDKIKEAVKNGEDLTDMDPLY